jgi:hypothetical protein
MNRRIILLGVVVVSFSIFAASMAIAMQRSGDVTTSDTMLQTSNRERLEICVQPVQLPALNKAEAASAVEDALLRVAQHPKWAGSGYAAEGGPTVDANCSTEPYLLKPGVEVVDGKMNPGSPIPEVSEPSRYKLFVFVLPPELLATVIKGKLDVRYARQEALCSPGQCFTVTTGIYLTPAELEETDFLVDWLQKGLSLERPVELGAPDGLQQDGQRPTP